MNKESAINAIKNDITDQRDLVVNQINFEISDFHENEIEFFKHSLEKEVNNYLEKEKAQLDLVFATQSNQAKLAIKRDLLKKRQEAVEGLFEEVKQNIKAFTETDKYDAYLEKQLTKVVDYKNGKILVRKQDEAKIAAMMKKMKMDHSIEVGNIQLGGFVFECAQQGIEFDLTLDQKLTDEVQWFQLHSKLVL